ncbi:MAG: prepilin-type N-terminal cleavage/methylation domain-containing protein [Lentisphaeria bacterium]|nr:prepilin-type N-terminal cleavage/methylation domain-containing protein [Lentisphaeria bacterium]
MKRVRHNFSLTEVLTVIAIVGILAAITAPVVIMSRDRGRETQAKGDITAIVTALKQLEADYHRVIGSGNKFGNTDSGISVPSNVATVTGNGYDAMIAELSAPKNIGLTVSVNKRKKIYLDPKKEFDPSVSYTGQGDALYRDPWGNPYVVYIKVTRDEQLAIPDTSKTIPGNFAAYSFGANGTDDKGCNADLENCISSGTHRDHDDIASWNI